VKVAFIGLGAMGLPMAKRILAAGHNLVTTWHRRREPAAELQALGASVVATPAEAARGPTQLLRSSQPMPNSCETVLFA
jgi:3-hydroxyisobutyrate dehydrogenase